MIIKYVIIKYVMPVTIVEEVTGPMVYMVIA